MKNARSFATNNGGTCMINVLRCYARSYVTNHGGLCMATDNGTHIVSLPTILGNSFEVYRHLQGTNGVKGEKGVENCSLRTV